MQIAQGTVLVALLALGSVANAKQPAKPQRIARTTQAVCGVAVAADGVAHVAYVGTNYQLYHASLKGKSWVRERVDRQSDYECGYGTAIAVGEDGSIHIAFATETGPGGWDLRYAMHDGESWSIESVGVKGTSPVLRLAADGTPHVLFRGSAGHGYARREVNGWAVEDMGLPTSWYSNGLALDADGVAHVSYAVNYSGCYYATNASGVWESTQLIPNVPGNTSVAVTRDGQPRVAVARERDGLHYFRRDDGVWSEEELVGVLTKKGAFLDGVALVLDGDDAPRMLLAVSVGGRAEVPVYVHHDGIGWVGFAVRVARAGYFPSLAIGNDGGLHGTFASALRGASSSTFHLRVALPDLSASWGPAEVSEGGGSSTIEAALTVRNTGAARSSRTTVNLWLSDDETLDGSDEALGRRLRVKRLAAGASTEFRVRVRHPAAVSGKYVIAVVDPGAGNPDVDRRDQVTAVLLQP